MKTYLNILVIYIILFGFVYCQYIDERNTNYKKKFGFPFVICVRENKKVVIMEQIEKRLHNDRETEVKTGIENVKKICHLRIQDIYQSRL